MSQSTRSSLSLPVADFSEAPMPNIEEFLPNLDPAQATTNSTVAAEYAFDDAHLTLADKRAFWDAAFLPSWSPLTLAYVGTNLAFAQYPEFAAYLYDYYSGYCMSMKQLYGLTPFPSGVGQNQEQAPPKPESSQSRSKEVGLCSCCYSSPKVRDAAYCHDCMIGFTVDNAVCNWQYDEAELSRYLTSNEFLEPIVATAQQFAVSRATESAKQTVPQVIDLTIDEPPTSHLPPPAPQTRVGRQRFDRDACLDCKKVKAINPKNKGKCQKCCNKEKSLPGSSPDTQDTPSSIPSLGASVASSPAVAMPPTPATNVSGKRKRDEVEEGQSKRVRCDDEALSVSAQYSEDHGLLTQAQVTGVSLANVSLKRKRDEFEETPSKRPRIGDGVLTASPFDGEQFGVFKEHYDENEFF